MVKTHIFFKSTKSRLGVVNLDWRAYLWCALDVSCLTHHEQRLAIKTQNIPKINVLRYHEWTKRYMVISSFQTIYQKGSSYFIFGNNGFLSFVGFVYPYLNRNWCQKLQILWSHR